MSEGGETSDEYSDEGDYGGGEFQDSPQAGRAGAPMGRGTQQLTNQPYDLAMEVASSEEGDAEEKHSLQGSEAGEEEDEEDEDDDVLNHSASRPAHGNPADFLDMPVSSEIRELFQYITRYQPQAIELDTRLKPFIPDYIPAIGELDSFLKIPRPDGQPDNLGLGVLDEPSAHQSDPVVLDLQLRALTKQAGLTPVLVRSIENADKNPKLIQQWISSIDELHRDRPPASVTYSRPMPDLEGLMQEWPREFEDLLSKVQLPSAALDVDTATYARIICSLLDIPVHTNVIESLHHLFLLYSDFESNPHFRNQG